ncbi:CynX/NimT family MFS transporter [Maridesulfovibrio bastinii]|uniref:MFS transporter n=1 Tax=Maridesulfovibrio bastinii TaxID=47157 RepID=UPI00068578CE|nr:MFS transporter [Maridesulfovibrio bastinii]
MQNTKVSCEDSTPKQSSSRSRLLMVLAFFALTLNLRAALTSLPPVIQNIKTMFDISDGLAGFLTSIPILCFGLLTPVISFLMKNLKLETSVFLTLGGIAIGSVLRSAGGMNAMIAGTTLIGISLTAGNIVGLMVLGREFSDNISAMTGLYVCGMSIGSMATMGLTAPLTHAIGWRAALALPVVFALVAILLWIFAAVGRKRADKIQAAFQKQCCAQKSETEYKVAQSLEARSSNVLKKSLVWILAVAFAAHTFLFYGITAWIPVYLEQTLGMSDALAGVVASLFQTLGLVGCFGIPALVKTGKFSTRARFTMVTVGWLLTAAGFWLAPRWWAAWVFCGGFASGGGFTVIFSMIMENANNLNENRTMSTVVQTVGYIVASISPFAIGHLHELYGSWQGGMAILTGSAVLMILCGFVATAGARRV